MRISRRRRRTRRYERLTELAAPRKKNSFTSMVAIDSRVITPSSTFHLSHQYPRHPRPRSLRLISVKKIQLITFEPVSRSFANSSLMSS